MGFVTLRVREGKMREQDLMSENIRHQIRRDSYVSLAIGLAFFVCTFPFSVSLIHERWHQDGFNILLTLNHAINPLVYAFKHCTDKQSPRQSITIEYGKGENEEM